MLLQSYAYAQIDTIKYHVQTMAAHASQEYLPLWIVSNRYGVLEDGTDILLRAGLEAPYRNQKKFGISFGLDMVGKVNDAFLQQGYLKIRYGKLELRGGRIEETTGTHHEVLSSGSLAQSRNARPIPKIALTFPQYVSVPFTNDYLKIKGYFGHGWLEKNRKIASPYLHEKNLYVKAGGKLPVNVHFGLVHYAIWAGTHPTKGKAPNKLVDYLRIITGKSGDRNDEGSQAFQGEIDNGLGNHLGIYDFGMNVQLRRYNILAYHQTFFEDLSGFKLFLNRDRLLGFSIKSKNEAKLINGLLYEYLSTIYQSGPGMHNVTGGRDNFYNNSLYRSGWTYYDRIIGTPLFTTSQRAKHYFSDLKDYNMIVNNRVIAHHMGFTGFLKKNMEYIFKATYTKNLGTYTGISMGPDYPFTPPPNQFYLLFECNTKLYKSLVLQTAFGMDAGDMTHNYGGLIGLKWQGIAYKAD